jgi:hypothetical protein
LFCSWLFSFWQVGDPHGRVGRVHALAARARGAEHVDLQVVVVDLHLDRLGLGRDEHARRRGVDAALGFGHRYPLHAVHAALVLQPGPGAVAALALHRDRGVLDPAQAGDGGVQDLGLPAAPLGVTLVHPQQVPGEQRGFLAAFPRLDLEDGVAVVVGVARHEQLAQLLLEFLAAGGELVGLVSERGVLAAEVAGRLLIRRGLLPLPVGVHDRGQLGVTAAKRARFLLVGVHGRVGERVLQLRVLAHQVA